MWWSDPDRQRRLLLVGGALVILSGCGFAPAYAPGGAAENYRDAVTVSVPETALGFHLKGRIEERLGRPADGSPYRLDVEVDVTESGVAVTPQGAVTRFTFVAVARFRLLDDAAGAALASGQVDSFTSYSTTDSTVATQAAREDAERRLARILADQIVTRLLASAG